MNVHMYMYYEAARRFIVQYSSIVIRTLGFSSFSQSVESDLSENAELVQVVCYFLKIAQNV